MKSRRGKRSEPFWPSIVMRKWLNIMPKVHEFSEDETDTESEDDGFEMLISLNLVRRFFLCCLRLIFVICFLSFLQDARSAGTNDHLLFTTAENEDTTQVSGEQVKIPTSRLRRRKSETLRVQYISNKDARIMIGTWNVAGRIPPEELELDDWLCTTEPADMYILGFQEVVPLNAGNVLGAEDNRPIPKWESIIRRTLNANPSEQKTLCKSYSAPPSLASRTLAFNNSLADKVDLAASQIYDQSNIDSLSCLNKLDWPEYSLDTQQRPLTSGTNLRRVQINIPRKGFGWLEETKDASFEYLPMNIDLKRVYHSSGDLGMLWSEQQVASDVLESLNFVFDKSSEDDRSPQNAMKKSENDEECSKPYARYVRIVSKQMVGIYISVWVCRRLRRHINNLNVSPVGVGLMGYMGNKGSVSVSMTLFQTRLCFVCSHLTSGHKEGDTQKRNSDVYDILRRTRFSSTVDSEQPETIPSHDRIFWFGDLNYRINMSDAEVRGLVSRDQWDELMNYDQLSNELRRGCIFDGWKEGPIDFPPTYKYEINSNRYVGENAKEGEKRRTPAWCDRILWLGKGIKQLSYRKSELGLSDHRPVSSIFSVEVEVFNKRKLQRAIKFNDPGLLPENLCFEEI